MVGDDAIKTVKFMLKQYAKMPDKIEHNDEGDFDYVKTSDGYIILNPRPWINAIKYIYENLPEQDRKIMEMYYFKSVMWFNITAELDIPKDYFYRRANRILYLTTLAAVQAGLVKI